MAISNFALLLYTPPPPSCSLANSGWFPILNSYKTVLPQHYENQLELRAVELLCGLRENVISLVSSMDVLEKDLLKKLRSMKKFEPPNVSLNSHHKSESLDDLCSPCPCRSVFLPRQNTRGEIIIQLIVF